MNEMNTDHPPTGGFEVIVCGAGPVGLVLANLLGASKIKVLLVERKVERREMSMAIGVTPPSLQILKTLGLDQKLVRRGVPIRKAFVHGGRGLLGGIAFDTLPGEYPFILSVPQMELIRMLEENLSHFPSVTYQKGIQLAGIENRTCGVLVELCNLVTGAGEKVDGLYLAACDGHKSGIRNLVGMAADEKEYGLSFLMGDFEDRTNLNAEAHLFFTPEGSVESFPLSNGRRRWVILTERFTENAPDGLIGQVVKKRTGCDLARSRQYTQSPFQVSRRLVRRYYKERVAFCGDAAHVMSPIGGQGMNTGIADAEFLADTLLKLCRLGSPPEDLFASYDSFRRHAFAVASARAARGMWLGTRTGILATRLRDCFIKWVLLRSSMQKALPAYFAMMTIPFNTLARVPAMEPATQKTGPLP